MALPLLPCSSSSSVLSWKHKPQFPASSKRFVSHFGNPCLVPAPAPAPAPAQPSSYSLLLRKARLCAVAEGINGEESLDSQNDDVFGEEEVERQKKLRTPCEVYVCNLPRSCDAAHLLDMFKPHGTILSVEVLHFFLISFFFKKMCYIGIISSKKNSQSLNQNKGSEIKLPH